MDRTILHCDMNAFYASVEELHDPSLKKGPMAVCGDPDSRHGIILAKNEQAKAFGIVTAETIWQARRKCPQLMLVKPHHERYSYYSGLVSRIYDRYTDMVEPYSIDESWLDVTGSLNLFGDGITIADNIRKAIREELGMTASVGVSYNKVFAKMGSEYKKPDGTTWITRENYKELLWPLPAGQLFFVGGTTAEKLAAIGVKTIGQLAVADRKMLVSLLGKHGELIHDYANGRDDSKVSRSSEKERIKSVGNGITFKRNLQGITDLKRGCIALADTVAGRLRKYGLKCQGVKVDIKDPFFKTISRQKQLERPSSIAGEISAAAMEIINSSWNMADPVRMLTITGINLTGENEDEQLSMLSLSNGSREKSEKVERALDHIRGKYGTRSITFGGAVGNDMGIGPWHEHEDEVVIINEEEDK